MSDGKRVAVPRVGDVGMREHLFLKRKLAEGHQLMETLLAEVRHLRQNNEHLRGLLQMWMTRENENENEKMEEEEEETDVMEEC